MNECVLIIERRPDAGAGSPRDVDRGDILAGWIGWFDKVEESVC